MTITLSSDLEKLATEKVARGEFESVEAVVAEALRQFGVKCKADDGPPARTRANTRAAIQRIRRLRKGVTLGPGVTIKQLVEEGRRY